MAGTLELSVPKDPASVREVRNAVIPLAREAGLTEEQISDVRLAVSEAVTNSILHGGDQAGDIHVRAAATRGELTVVVGDDGRGIQPRPSSDGLGMGMAIIANVSDHLDVATGASGTTITMRFRASPAG